MTERNVDLVIRAKNDASKAFEDVGGALNRLARIQEKVAAGAALMEKALSSSEDDARALTRAIAESKSLRDNGFNEIGVVLDKLSAKLAENRDRVAQTITKYADLGTQLSEAKKALDRVRNAEGIDADKQTSQIAVLEKTIRSLQSQYEKLGNTLAQQSADLAATEQNFNRVSAAAAATDANIRELTESQRRQAAAIAGNNAQQRLAGVLDRVAAASKTTAVSQTQLAAAFRAGESNTRAWLGILGRATNELARLGSTAERAGVQIERSGRAMNGFRGAINAFYGDSRRALSLAQRLRGEVLSLTASFVGFYGVFNVGRSITDSFSSLEAATVRLNAAFDGNATQVEAELANLRAEADRLGISFDVLSDQYSKFTISGQAAGLGADELRTIFTQVAEAGRVLKLSNDQIEGTFNALTQIAGKGTLQMEELRQQLGDRIPGSVGLLAEALGYGADELDDFYKAVENGEVGAREALLAFGQAMEDQFGAQLAEALDTVQAKIGRLQNLLFERQLTAANSGFIAGLETALAALNEFLSSDDGIAFFEALGAAFGRFFELLPVVIDNIDLIVLALKALVAIKIAQTIRGWADSVRVTGVSVVAFRQQLLSLNASAYAVAPAFGRAVTAAGTMGTVLRGLRAVLATTAIAFRGFLAAFGGPLGIAVAALSFFAVEAVAGAVTATDELNSILETHKTILGQVAQAHVAAAGDVEKFRKKLEDVSSLQIEENLRNLRDSLKELRAEDSLGGRRGANARFNRPLISALRGNPENAEAQAAAEAFEKVALAYANGEGKAQDVKNAMLALRAALGETSDEVIELLAAEERQLDKLIETEAAIEKSERVLAARNGTLEETTALMDEMADATEKAGRKTDNAAKLFGVFEDAMRELAKSVPGLNEELKRLDAFAKIESDLQSALTAARNLPEEIMRVAAAQDALNRAQAGRDAIVAGGLSGNFTGATSGEAATLALLREREGFESLAYNDPRTDRNGNQVGPNIYRAGYGSDTITLSDGTIQQITRGMTVTREDAERDLRRRVREEFLPRARAQVGARFDTFSPQQQGALGSIAYNYGELPDRILDALRNGTNEQIADAIRSLSGDNGGINAGRRAEEAAVFTQGVGSEAASERAADRVQDQIEVRDALQQQLDTYRQQVALENESKTNREIAEEIAKAEAEYKKVGLELTEAERKAIEETIRAKNAKRDAEDANNKKLEEGQKLLDQITRLENERTNLQDRRDFAESNGDTSLVAQTETAISEVEGELNEAIDRAREFWAALGGDEALATLATLDQTQERLNRVKREVILTGRQANEMIADGATAAFDRFAQAVANGEDPLTALRESFQQFAAEFLIEIGKMIIRQALLNALQGGGGEGGGVGGLVAGAVNALFHGGGIAGHTAGPSRTVNPMIFANAARYHGGGIAGLRPDEVPAVLKQGEEVITEGDPRHRGNGGGAGQGMTIINTFDAEEVMERALSTPRGQKALVNAVRGNNTQVKAALG